MGSTYYSAPARDFSIRYFTFSWASATQTRRLPPKAGTAGKGKIEAATGWFDGSLAKQVLAVDDGGQ
jgi:hypothetical protein